jgi:hypothetical protein
MAYSVEYRARMKRIRHHSALCSLRRWGLLLDKPLLGEGSRGPGVDVAIARLLRLRWDGQQTSARTLEDEEGQEALRIKVWRGGSASIASVRAGRY